MNHTADELHRAADRAERTGASEVAVQILRRAAEFAERKFGTQQPWQPYCDDANEDA